MRAGFIAAVIFVAGFSVCVDAAGSPACDFWGMRCEYLESPLGVDVQNPRLTWRLPDGIMSQETYRVLVGRDSSAVSGGHGDMWDSGTVASDEILVRYAGEELSPFSRYYWKVLVDDEAGHSHESGVSSFETGLMGQRNWKGWWITDCNDIELRPAAAFRKEFNAGKKIASARAYIAAAGLFELYINGSKAGDHRLDPVYTRFDRRTMYVTFDVTPLLREGGNAVGVLMGNGWYNHQSLAVWNFETAPWRDRPCFCMDIRVTYEDGTVETWFTGQDWKTSLSEITFNSIYTAEHQDARLGHPGWTSPGFDDSSWKGAENTSAPSGNIVSQLMRPIRDADTLRAVSVTRLSDTSFVFDFGRNIAGVSELSVSGDRGTQYRLVHSERLGKDGHADQSNIDYFYNGDKVTEPFQTDIFTLAGTGETERFRQLFGYKGFRYVEVSVVRPEGKSDEPASLSGDNLVAYFMHSDVPARGHIHSSDTLINRIWEAGNASYLSNLFGYPTDCPQREKNGWTGDAHIASELGLYNFDGITVYEKWLRDHKDAQLPNGVLPSIIPTDGWGYNWGNGTDWTSTVAIIPWNVYMFYGDSSLLGEMYENIKAYVDHIDGTWKDGLTDWGLGDWIPIKSSSDKWLTSSIYYYVDADILAKAAALFGRHEDAEHYSSLARKIRDAINGRFLDRETGIYASGLQTELSMPLYWGIVPDECRDKVAANLAAKVEADGGLDVGLLGTKAILGALSENGYADLAYRLASNDRFPSWGYWIANGATTMYENWRIDGSRDISLNHIMFGEIGAWFYKALGGIRPDPASPGFRNVILKPSFVEGLGFFEASHIAPRGEILSSWKRKGKRIIYTVKVPSGSTATVILPDGVRNIESGEHTFTVKI